MITINITLINKQILIFMQFSSFTNSALPQPPPAESVKYLVQQKVCRETMLLIIYRLNLITQCFSLHGNLKKNYSFDFQAYKYYIVMRLLLLLFEQ